MPAFSKGAAIVSNGALAYASADAFGEAVRACAAAHKETGTVYVSTRVD